MLMYTITYSTKLFPFAFIVRNILNCPPLEDLEGPKDTATAETDQSSKWHKWWYESNIDVFLDLYRKFIAREIYPLTQLMWQGGLLYQTKPTIRFHYQGNKAVGEFHRDRDYSHNPAEINIFLPMTNAYASNTLWIEDEERPEFNGPVEAWYGQAIMFDGANLKHGNYVNITEDTRVSFDFRILQPSKYIPGKFSKAQHKKMEIGDYWTQM